MNEKQQKYYRDKKSGAFKFVDPGTVVKHLYFKSRKDYKQTLIKLLIATVNRLETLGVNVKVLIDDSIKQQDIKEAA